MLCARCVDGRKPYCTDFSVVFVKLLRILVEKWMSAAVVNQSQFLLKLRFSFICARDRQKVRQKIWTTLTTAVCAFLVIA